MKKCFRCSKILSFKYFYKHPQMGDGHLNKCKECTKSDVRENYKKNIEYYRGFDKKRQRQDINRILSHRYNSMRQRVEGRGIVNYRVGGMEILTKTDWNKWCQENMESFMEIYQAWEESGFNTKLTPSIDRIDPRIGYTYDNIQWLSKSDNCSKYTKIGDTNINAYWTRGKQCAS